MLIFEVIIKRIDFSNTIEMSLNYLHGQMICLYFHFLFLVKLIQLSSESQ